MSNANNLNRRCFKTDKVTKYTLVFISLIYSFAYAQIIDVKKYVIDENEDLFNYSFIKNNAIKSISAEIYYKKEMKPISTSNLIQQYYFASEGYLKKHIATNKITGNKIDTTVIYSNYKNGLLAKKIQLDSKGFYSHTFERNENKLIVKDTYAREENKGYSRFNFIQGKSFEIFYETFSYQLKDDKVFKKRISNSDGKPYNDIYYEYDEYENLIKETSTLVVTKKSRFKLYKYNEYHQLVEKREESNFFGKSIVIHSYTYDEASNLMSEKVNKNGTPKTSKEFVYDSNMMLKAILIKDEGSSVIKITKFKTSFFN
jgi:hypothetical protein